MTFDEFRAAHPCIIQYDKAGIEGIDFGALHARIEKSRYLKSRQSFVFMVKHYSEILAGRYDDFTLEIMPDKKEDPKELERNEIKDYLAKLKLITKEQRAKIRKETGISVEDTLCVFRSALDSLDRPPIGFNDYGKYQAKKDGIRYYKQIKEFLDVEMAD